MLKSRHACFGCYCVLLAFALMNHNSLVSPVAAFSSLTTNKNRHHNNNYRGFTMRPQATDGPTITIRANLRQASSKDDNAQESNNKARTCASPTSRGTIRRRTWMQQNLLSPVLLVLGSYSTTCIGSWWIGPISMSATLGKHVLFFTSRRIPTGSPRHLVDQSLVFDQ